MTAPKSFSDLPSWQDIEQSEGFSALDQQKKNEAYDLWSSDYTRLAIENPDELNPGDWEFFKKANARKKAELSGNATPLDLDDAEDASLDLQPKVSSLVDLANQFEELDKKYQVGQTTPEEWDAHDALKKVFTPEKKDLAEKIKAIQASSDDESMIHDGEFIASPSLLLKKKEYAEAIRNSTLTDEQKADALFQGRMLRDRVGSSLREQIRQADEVMADTWLGGLNSFKEFEEIEKQRDQDQSDADIMEAWQRKTGMFSNMGTQFKLGLFGGGADLISTYYGLKQLTGLGDQETAMSMGQAALEVGQKLGAAGEAIGGATALKSLTQAGVGMLPQVISGWAAGAVTAAGRFALAGAGRIAATAGLRRAAVASVATRLGTEASKKLAAKAAARAATSTLAQTMILSGVQSAGASFQSTYDDYLKEEVDMLPTAQKEDPQALALAKERARKSARGRSLVSGAVTGIVTGAFGLTGLESFGKAAKDVIARPGWQEAIKAGLGSYLIRTAGKEFSSEFSEEAIDNVANDLVDKIALGGDKPIGDIIKESLEAGIVGGVLGGGIGTAKALFDVYEARKQAKTNPNIRQQLEAAERAANAGLPAVSAVVREKAEAQVESLTQQQLDEKAAQQTAEAEKALQQPPATEAPVSEASQVQPAYRPATEVARAVEDQLNGLPADDPQREVLQQRLEGLRMAISANPDAMVPMLEPEQAATAEGAADPFAPPGEAPSAEEAPVATPADEEVPVATPSPAQPPAPSKEMFDALAVGETYTSPDGTVWTRRDNQFGEPVMVSRSEGGQVRLPTADFASLLLRSAPAPTPPVASLPRGQKKEAQPAASKSVFDRPGPGFGEKRTVRELAEQGGPGRDPLLVPGLPKFPIGDGAQVTTNTGEKVTLNDDPRWDEGLGQWMYPTTVGAYQERNLVSVSKEAPMSGKALLGIPRGRQISGAVVTFTRASGPPTFTAAPPPTETVPAEAPAKAKAKRVRRTKAEAQPETPKPRDTETKEPQASSVPPVEREPAVESPAGQAQEGTAPRIGKGQKAEARGVTEPEQPTPKEEVLTEPSEIVLKIAERFGGRVAWSQGDLAIIEGFQLFGSKSLYIAVVGNRYSLTDFTLMESEQRKSLLGNNEDLFLRKREEIIETNNRMLAENPDGPFTNGQTTVVSKNVPQNTAAVFREWVRLLGLNAPTRIVLTTPQDAIDMASKYGGKFRRIGVTSLMRDNERGQMTPLGENDFHIFYKEDVSYARTLEVLAHELGHILERQAFENLPDDQRKAIITEHEKWLKRVGSQKALNGIRELRSMRVGKIHPSFSQMDDRFDSLGAYWTSFSEWFADQVARWATTTDKPLTVVEKFFARLGKKLREFFNLKGSQFAPNQQVADWLNSLSPDLNAVVEATLAPAETTTKDSLPVGQAQEGTAPRTGKGQKAETRGVAKLRKAAVKEVAVKPAPVKAAAEKVAKATTPVTKALAAKVDFAPAGSPAQMATTYYPALEELMFNDEMRVPNTAQINALLKENTNRGLPNGDPALTDLLARLQAAWSAKYPSERGVPATFLVGAHKGSVRPALEEKTSREKSANELNGVFPVKIVSGKKVGFFTNDPTLTARQFSAGLAPKIPANIIRSGKVHPNIKFDVDGNVTSVIHPKYGVEIKSLGQLQQVYKESPQKAKKAEIRVGNIDKKLADAAKQLGVSPDKVMDRLGELIASAENTYAIAIQNGNTQVLAIAKANIAKYTAMLGSLQSATQPEMPSASFVGKLLADYPVPAPNEESLLSEYLLLDEKNQTTKLETMIRQTLSNRTLRAKGAAVEQEVLTGVINTALREIRAASSRNDGAEVDPAKLRPIRGIVEDMVKETERKQVNHRSISTVSRDELNAEGAALVDPSDEAPNPAETMMVREEEELTNAPVSPELAAELKEGMLKLFPNQKISGPDSIAAQTQRLVQNPAQARRAAEFLKAKIPFSVGLDGELVFSYGKKLTGEELASLVKLMDKINIPATGLPKGEKTLLERLDKNPNVGRFFLEASLYLRDVLLDVKMTDGSPMYTEAAINKKNFLELTRLAGTETTNRALDAARSNLDRYIDLPDVSLPRAMAVVTYALGGKRARVARTDRGIVRLVFDPRDPGYSSSAMLDKSSSEWASYDRQTRVLMTYQTEEEAKVHREVMVESLRGFVGTARTKMAALEERVKKAEEQLAYLKGTIPSLGEVGPPTQAAITKRTAEISRIERNRDGMVAEFSSLDDSVQQAEATLADIVAPPVSALPDSPEKAAIKEAFVKKLQRMSQVFKNQVERARAAGATESTRLARSVAISREVTATAPGSAWPRTIHETSLYDAGIKSGESAASLRSALSRLANTVDKNRPPAIQHLAKMIVDNQALMEGIEGVDVIHDPMLRMDAVVNEGILVINTASMPGTVMTEQEAKHLAVEAALRALIHNAAANLTAPDAVLTDSQRQALDSLEQLRQEAIEAERKTRPDGLQSRFAPHLKDVASFVSGVMTSPEFANMLQGYKTSVKIPGLKSVWGRFWKALANLLTGRDTAFGSALHASLMESGRLFALNPPPGPSVMDNMVAAMSDPGIAFPSSRTSQVAELAHIERVEEAMDTADSSEAITTAQDRLLGFGTGNTETEQANEGVLPDNMALGAPGKVAKKKKPARVAKAAPATPTPEAPATPTPTARAKKKAPSKKTPWQFFNSIKGATAVVQRAQQSVEGAEDVEMPSDEELNTAREQLCQKIQTLRNSSYSDKKRRIRALEKLVSQIDLHLSESPTPPLDTDSESVVAVAGETPEVLPPADEETEVEDALPETQTEEQAEEEAAESDEDPEQHQEAEPETAPINGAELSRQVSESTGYSVTFVVSAAPDSETSEPVFVTHDRNDRTIYVRNQQVENLIKQGMDAGMSREAAQKYAFEKVLEDAETMAIVHKFSDGELLRTYEEMTVKERQEIIKKVYGLKPGMPGYAEASGRSKNLSLEQMTQQRAAIAVHYLRRLRQLATTGFTTEDVVAMRNKPQSAVARAVAYLRASARQFFTRWNTYGNVYAVRAILNAEDFLTQLGESPVAGSSMLTDPGKIPAAEVVPTLARVLGKTSAEIEEDIEEGLRIRKLLLNDKDFGDENMTRPMEADEMAAFLDELGLKDGDPTSVAEALRRISEMDGVDPVVQNVAKYLSEHADIANLAAFSTTMKGISVRSRNGQFVEPAGLYYSTQHALVINTNAEYPISKNSFIETFLHECTHATTSIAIQKYTNYKKSGSVGDAPLAPDTMKAVAELETILNGVRDFAKKNGDTQYDYRLSDVEEFVAGVLTDTRFTSWLSSVPNSAVAGVGSDSNTSLIKRILMRIYRIAWPDLDTNVTVMKSLDRIFNIAARPQVVITPVSPSKEVLGVFTPEQFAAAPERLRERQAGSEVLNVDYDAFIEKASSAISEASRDASANLPAVGNKQARRFVSDGDRQAMLERMRPTRALLNSIPGLAPSVQAMLAGAEYAGSVNSDDLSVVEARIGPALRSAVGPAEYQELAGRLADYNLTPVQSQIALAVIVKGLNDRLVSLSSMGVTSSARFAVERDFARTAEILSRRLQDIRSNNAQELQIGNLIRNILNPAYAARTYRTSMVDKAREMLEGSPETAAAVETVKGIATAAADEAAATAVGRSTLPRRVAEAGGRAAGADPEMVQTMFDFMEELASLQARGTIQTSGLPIPADMANWVADRMVQMMKGRLTKAGSDERTFLEEYSDEVRRQVAARINAVLKEGADAGESAPSLVDRLITSLEFAPMVESALNQSREAILARLVPGPDATPEQIAAYGDARTRLAGLTYDIVPLDTAIKVVRKSFNMRQQVLLELTDQHTSLEALTAMIAESADLSETQAAALAKSFRTAYEAEARRVTEKMLKDYAQRIKDAKIRGPVEKLTKSEKFLQLARLGGLRDEEVYDAMAKEFGLPSYDPEVAARLDAEAVRISEMPQGSVQRLDATRELNASVVRELFNQLLSAQGVSALRKNPEMFWKYLRDIPISMWKSGVLSGFGTQQVNFAMGTIQSVMDLGFNSVAYAAKAKDPSLAAGNFLTLLRSVGWMFDPATRKETWLEMKRAAMTGRTRFASEQSENMLVLEQDIPPPDIPVVKQLMSGTKNFFKLLGRLISIVDATVSVPAYVARQRMALAYAMSMQGIQGKHAADLMRASFSPDETTMREVNAIVESEKAHFSSSPRPDLAMQARRMQLLEQRRAELYDKITDGMSDIDRENFIEASRESASFANLSGKPVGIMGAIFDGCFGQLERATGGATSILFSFVKAMANMFDFSAAMSFPLGAISFARAFNASPSALMDQNNKYRRKRVERGSVEFYKLITQGFAALAIQSTVAALYVAGLEDEKEDREPNFMVYGEGPADPELAAQLRYRQPRWKPYTLKVGSLYLNWKDLPGFNIMMSGLAAVTDGMMNSKTKDPSKLRSERETVKYAIGLVRSVIAKNSMQGIMDAAEILSDNTIAKASADVKAVKMATNFVSGVTNPRLIRDIADIGRGIAGGGEFALPQVSNYSQALQTLVPGHTVTTDTDAMVNMVGRPITNFWFAPLTKRLLPMTADDGYDPILTPLVSAGLEVSPVKSSAKIATLKSDSDEIDPAGGTLGSFSPEVQVKASKLFGEYLDRTMTQKYIEDVTRRGRLGGESLKAAQEEIDRLCTDARKYATDMIESEVLQRKIKPHWQE